ncbi:transketolase family protein [Lacrimispora sp. 210928-DFI.3.58]|uniref:transketolase family protein n=1 Tax=Lacrimispora sp. 210928-DFI.3.58 TaxID=2883214 RepID=UPI0015B6E1C4|nr:transketolase family protein [Lacrimispora sp. 210928-DFI.3.58]MCB7318891.1 transketolase family protein [Lacrimispora sp. 210928-DFI.3.58]
MSELKAIRVAYGEALAELGEKNEKVVVLDADLAHATMTATFGNKFPERFFNAGIAEANMVDMAAGLSTMGYIPFASTFAIFGTGRAYDQVRNGCAYPNFNVKFGMTHAGITLGEDGGSHQAIEDLALMRVIPGMTVIVPCDAKETHRAVAAVAEMQGPAYLRLARLPSPVFEEEMPFEIGKANVLREGTDVAVFSCGIMVSTALECAKRLEADGISAAVINMHTIKPIDRECILKYAGSCKKIVTVEEHSVIGGLGDAVGDVLLQERCHVAFKKIGVQDRFGQSGKPSDLLEEYGLSEDQVYRQIKEMAGE